MLYSKVTVRVRHLVPTDLDAAEALLTEAYGRADAWRAELEAYHTLQPEGWFVATLDGQIVGVGGAHDYGPFASIGLMATYPSAQRRGIATTILDHVVSWLQGRGCPVVILDASAAGAPVYERYGFLDSGTTAVFQQDTPGEVRPPSGRVSPLRFANIAEVADFDTPLFGADRSNVLSAMFAAGPNRAFLSRDDSGTLTGYLFAQPQRLGPWMAATARDAEALLDAALALPFEGVPTVLVPSVNPSAARLLSMRGFVEQRALRHMYLGPAAPRQDRARLYGQVSFAIG